VLLEAYIWALSKAVPGARKAGLVYEVAGIAGRHQRHKNNWAPHLENTRHFIVENLPLADENEPVLVLGAGLGLDLPLDALNSHKSGALLCDAVETPLLRKKLKKYPNLSFERSDLTGLLAPFWADDSCDSIRPPLCAPMPLTGYSMVVSCNILSQLPLSFAGSPPISENEIRLTAAIQQAHMKALKAMECPVLLITDYERIDKIGMDEKTITMVAAPLLPGDPIQSWDWHIAPKGELAGNREVTLRVGAWLLGT